ncbi:MAG: Dabb family protein [Planctomycetes bacterium]|nr:Dabb family protein [Planctomycetota bacterium]
MTRSFFTVLLLLLPACGVVAPVEEPGRVAHTVFFWLKPDAPAGTANEMVAYYRSEVAHAPGVVSVTAGVPRPSERDVVDDSFTVGTTVVFASSDAELAWQTEPIHDRMKERFFAHVERVAVYDTLVTRGR